MAQYAEAESAFNQLMDSEELEFEPMPFRPGKHAKFVLTDYQKETLQRGIDQIDKYFKGEDRHPENNKDNKRLRDLHAAMKKIRDKGVDSLSAGERKTVREFNEIMNADYHRDPPVKTLIAHMDNLSGTYEMDDMAGLHAGLDMLGVLTGNPATYDGNRTAECLDERAAGRKRIVDNKMLFRPEVFRDLEKIAERAQIRDLKYKVADELSKEKPGINPDENEIVKRLGQINDIIRDLGNYKYGKFDIQQHLKAADGLGPFLNAKGENGKTNYEIITGIILGKEKTNDQKKAFDLLLGQLNIVCDLDINVPDAIEAQKEYEWNLEQQAMVDAERITGLNDKVFGEDTKVHAWDEGFLESVEILADRIRETKNAFPEEAVESENSTKMRKACLGFENFVEVIKHNSLQNKLDTGNDDLVEVLDFGKTLRRKHGNETLYELLARKYEAKDPVNGRDKLNDTLKELNDRLDLKIRIPGQKIEAEEAGPEQQKQLAEPPFQHDIYKNRIKEVQRLSNRMENPEQLKLALANVLALRRMSVDPAHAGHEKVRTKAANAKAVALMETKAFKELTKDMSADDLAKKIYHPGNFDKAFTEKLKTLDLAAYEERMKDKTCRRELMACAKNAAAKMIETGTGVYLLGVKRGKNSGMYDRAVLAMQAAEKNPDAATTMQSVQTVKEYLSNKMPPRVSRSGRERWQNCMEFLCAAMPPEEFKAYCNQVNAVRKAKEGSSSYIDPDLFAPKEQQRQRNSLPAKRNGLEEAAEPGDKQEEGKQEEKKSEEPEYGSFSC